MRLLVTCTKHSLEGSVSSRKKNASVGMAQPKRRALKYQMLYYVTKEHKKYSLCKIFFHASNILAFREKYSVSDENDMYQ